MKITIGVLAALVVVCPFVSVNSTIINVPDDQPTIQVGIDVAVDGDTVLVAPGIYTENISFHGKRAVVISSSGPEYSTIVASDQFLPAVALHNNEPPGTEISGFTITGSIFAGIDGVASSPRITRNVISGNAASTGHLNGGGIYFNDAENVRILANVFDGNNGGDGGGGVYLRNMTNTIVKSNIFTENTATYGPGIFVDGGVDDTICYNLFYHNHGISEIRGINCIVSVHNNTISASDWCAIAIEHGGYADVRNNICFHGLSFGIRIDNGTSGIAEYNCTYANATDYVGVTPGTGSIFTDAMLVDTINANYELTGGSLCIDAGDPSVVLNDPNGTRNDMGAFPFVDCIDDDDGDGIVNCEDNCPTVWNPSQENADADAVGDSCDTCTDTDGDSYGNVGFPTNTCPDDNCPIVYNPDQDDFDADGIGDSCDICTDTDDDGFGNLDFPANTCPDDNCPDLYSLDQTDSDGDGNGDPCDLCPGFDDNMDEDSDIVPDGCDNCLSIQNPNQEDEDDDGRGDICDNCPQDANYDQADSDVDGVGDVCDACPGYDDNIDLDGDTVPDGCDACPGFDDLADADADTIADGCDNCVNTANTDQTDGDNDGIGDVCDNCPVDANHSQADDDSDDVGNVCDNCPDDPNTDQADIDDDGIGDVCDACVCYSYHCDLDGEYWYSPLDVAYIVSFVFKQEDSRQEHPSCLFNNGDWNCDGSVDPLDVSFYVQFVFKQSGVGPCDPCDCADYPSDCPEFP